MVFGAEAEAIIQREDMIPKVSQNKERTMQFVHGELCKNLKVMRHSPKFSISFMYKKSFGKYIGLNKWFDTNVVLVRAYFLLLILFIKIYSIIIFFINT